MGAKHRFGHHDVLEHIPALTRPRVLAAPHHDVAGLVASCAALPVPVRLAPSLLQSAHVWDFACLGRPHPQTLCDLQVGQLRCRLDGTNLRRQVAQVFFFMVVPIVHASCNGVGPHARSARRSGHGQRSAPACHVAGETRAREERFELDDGYSDVTPRPSMAAARSGSSSPIRLTAAAPTRSKHRRAGPKPHLLGAAACGPPQSKCVESGAI